MSDAILPPPRSSSIPLPLEPGTESSTSERDFDTSLDASLVYTSKDEGAGDSESKGDGKQKRKRTSPTDQAILESEYKKNPKPNKAARAEVVEKVSLNEKEVQIWFQNRRQINRRKSRPLLPHEIAAFGLGGISALSSDPASGIGNASSDCPEARGQSPIAEAGRSQEESNVSQVQCVPSQSPEVPVEAAKIEKTDTVADAPLPPPPTTLTRQSSSGISAGEGSPFSGPENAFKSFASTPGYLSNRWNSVNSSNSTPSSIQHPTFTTPAISQTKQPASCPERLTNNLTPSSSVRLSMSLDGKAELVSTTPSPPHLYASRPSSSEFMPQKRMRTLQRSQSALPLSSQSGGVALTPPFIPRLGTGRSRDARTWEFCCDGDTRDELTTQAERESDGSAVAAISLLRSTSNSALKSNPNKRNASAGKQDSSKNGKKPKLGRAQSSLARLQFPRKAAEQLSGMSKDGLMGSPSGDSDKENWLPGEQSGAIGNARRRPLPAARAEARFNPRTVLGENNTVPTYSNLGGKSRKRKTADVGSNIFEDQENSGEGSEEVEKFMRGEVSPSKKGDLDCIQGLLSLSQGNWR